MGYRSDVKILIRNDLLKDLKKKYAKEHFECDLFGDYKPKEEKANENFTVISWDNIKWYSHCGDKYYDGMEFVEDYVKDSEDVQFMRMGEYYDDFEEIYNLNNYPGCGLCLDRKIVLE